MKLTCGHCRRFTPILMSEVKQAARITYERSGAKGVASAVAGADREGMTQSLFSGGCPLCAGISVMVCRMPSGATTAPSLMKDVKQYPPPPALDAPAVWPDTLRTAWEDILKMQTSGVSAAHLATATRTCLQHAMRLLGAKEAKHGKGSGIAQEIDDLRDRNIITAALAEWAHDLRRQGAAGTHEFAGDPERVEEAIDFLRLFLYLTFTLQAEIDQRRHRASI